MGVNVSGTYNPPSGAIPFVRAVSRSVGELCPLVLTYFNLDVIALLLHQPELSDARINQ